jgi:uncharacterized membrane protein YfcA
MLSAIGCPYFRKAFAWCVPIGALGGLVGLGGGEFRLPVLIYAIGFGARSSVPVNLLTSLITLAFALAVRSHTVTLTSLRDYLPGIAGLAMGGVVSAFYGARLVSAISDRRLVLLIAGLLAALGVVLTGLWRYWKLDALPRGRGAQRISAAMGDPSLVRR